MSKTKENPPKTQGNPAAVFVIEQLLKQARIIRTKGTPEEADVALRKEKELTRELEEAKLAAA